MGSGVGVVALSAYMGGTCGSGVLASVGGVFGSGWEVWVVSG